MDKTMKKQKILCFLACIVMVALSLFFVGCTNPDESSTDSIYSGESTESVYEINAEEKNIALFETFGLQITKNGEKVSAEWTSNSTDIASVDSKGVVTANSVGTTSIIGSIDGKSFTCQVTVVASTVPNMSFNISEKVTLRIDGEPYVIYPQLTYKSEKIELPTDLNYEVSNSEMVAIEKQQDGSCVLVGKVATETEEIILRASCTWYGIKLYAEISVEVKGNADVILSEDDITIYTFACEGYSTQKQILVEGVEIDGIKQANAEVVWTSSDSLVATVTEEGLVSAIATGQTTVLATWTDENGFEYSTACTVRVEDVVLDYTSTIIRGSLNDSVIIDPTMYTEADFSQYDLTFKDITNAENAFVYNATKKDGTYILSKDQLVSGEAIVEINCEDECKILIKIRVLSLLVKTADDLDKIAEYTEENALIELANNINLGMRSISSEGTFRGEFDGKGYSIIGGVYRGEWDGCSGLFGQVTATGIIKNVAFVDVTIEGEYSATIAGRFEGTIDNVLVDVVSAPANANMLFGETGTDNAVKLNNVVTYFADDTENRMCFFKLTWFIEGTTLYQIGGHQSTWTQDWSNATAEIGSRYAAGTTCAAIGLVEGENGFNEYWDFSGSKAAFKSWIKKGTKIITTAEELLNLHQYAEYETIELGNNIDLGTTNVCLEGVFNSVFDGKGYSIIGGVYTGTWDGYSGLFGQVAATGIIKNVALVDATISGDYAATLAGKFDGTLDNVLVDVISAPATAQMLFGETGTNNAIKLNNVIVYFADDTANRSCFFKLTWFIEGTTLYQIGGHQSTWTQDWSNSNASLGTRYTAGTTCATIGLVEGENGFNGYWDFSGDKAAFDSRVNREVKTIMTAEELLTLHQFNDYSIIQLGRNIDLGTTSVCAENIFSGVFDGKGYSIIGGVYTGTWDGYSGLFGQVSATGIIKNVAFVNAIISGDYAATIAGKFEGALDNVLVDVVSAPAAAQMLFGETGTDNAVKLNNVVVYFADDTENRTCFFKLTWFTESANIYQIGGHQSTWTQDWSNSNASLGTRYTAGTTCAAIGLVEGENGFNEYWDFSGDKASFESYTNI